MLPHPCILEDPECQAHEAKSEVANPPCLLGAQKRAKMVRHPNVLGWHWWQNCNIYYHWRSGRSGGSEASTATGHVARDVVVPMPPRDELGDAHTDPPLDRVTLAARQPDPA